MFRAFGLDFKDAKKWLDDDPAAAKADFKPYKLRKIGGFDDVEYYNEVFSPGVHTQLTGAVGVAGQGFSESAATSARPLDAASRGGSLRYLAGGGA